MSQDFTADLPTRAIPKRTRRGASNAPPRAPHRLCAGGGGGGADAQKRSPAHDEGAAEATTLMAGVVAERRRSVTAESARTLRARGGELGARGEVLCHGLQQGTGALQAACMRCTRRAGLWAGLWAADLDLRLFRYVRAMENTTLPRAVACRCARGLQLHFTAGLLGASAPASAALVLRNGLAVWGAAGRFEAAGRMNEPMMIRGRAHHHLPAAPTSKRSSLATPRRVPPRGECHRLGANSATG